MIRKKSWVFEGANLFISMFKDKAQLKRLGEIAIREKEIDQRRGR